MPGPGRYRPDPTEGTTRIDDLPRTKVGCRSRNYRRRPCPRCGHSSYRDRLARRTLHDLGNPPGRFPSDLARKLDTVYIHPTWSITSEGLLIRTPAWKPKSL